MHLHSSSLDLQKFHAEQVSRSSLPSDSEYGGVCGNAEELHQQHNQELLEMCEYFEYEEKTWNNKQWKVYCCYVIWASLHVMRKKEINSYSQKQKNYEFILKTFH